MKTEPKIGDTVWIYTFDRLWKCRVSAILPIYGATQLTYKLVPQNDTCFTPGTDELIIQERYLYSDPREALNGEIKHVNDNIRTNKKELDLRRSVIKDLKHKRADFQRMLEKYPKPS